MLFEKIVVYRDPLNGTAKATVSTPAGDSVTVEGPIPLVTEAIATADSLQDMEAMFAPLPRYQGDPCPPRIALLERHEDNPSFGVKAVLDAGEFPEGVLELYLNKAVERAIRRALLFPDTPSYFSTWALSWIGEEFFILKLCIKGNLVLKQLALEKVQVQEHVQDVLSQLHQAKWSVPDGAYTIARAKAAMYATLWLFDERPDIHASSILEWCIGACEHPSEGHRLALEAQERHMQYRVMHRLLCKLSLNTEQQCEGDKR